MSQIPNITHPIWEKLMSGKVKHKFSLFAANMAVDRAARAFATDKNSKQQLINDLHEFFNKYASIVAAELVSIA